MGRQSHIPISQTLTKAANHCSGRKHCHARGITVWLTGLSGAGKTTIANALRVELLARGFRVELLDGDMVRNNLCRDLDYSKHGRNENVRRIGFVANLLARNGTIVLVSAISPYRDVREEVRATIHDYMEVYVNAPLHVCEQRDPKGLYKKARAGEIACFTGISDPYEEPLAPDIRCETDRESLKSCTDKILMAVLAYLQSGAMTRENFIQSNSSSKQNEVNDSPMQPPDRQLTIAVDFDGVVADYHGWKGCDVLGVPRSDVRHALNILHEEGWKIIIHTTRAQEHIIGYLRDNCIPYDEINCNSGYANKGAKPVATVYWDDRALRYSGDALSDLESIRQFRTWSGRR